MGTVANSKGQIIIPIEIRRQLDIKAGTYIHSLRGKYKGKGLMKALMEVK